MREKEDGSLQLLGLHQGHRTDVSADAADEPSAGINFWSHGQWQHCAVRLGPMLVHLAQAQKILAKYAYEDNLAHSGQSAIAAPRRELQRVSMAKLEEILTARPEHPPEIQTNEEAQLLAIQAEARGFEALLIVISTYPAENSVIRHSLDALTRLLAAKSDCSVEAVTAAGGCELVVESLARFKANSDVISAAVWCLSLLAERAETSRYLLTCDLAPTLVDALRNCSEYGTFHYEAQAWGTVAFRCAALLSLCFRARTAALSRLTRESTTLCARW